MADGGHRCGGFTLVEMLVAIGILAFGFTSLIGLLGVGVSTRRTAELRNQAVQAADGVLDTVRRQVAAARAGADEDGPMPPPGPMVFDSIDGYPRLRAEATFQADEGHPDLLLVSVHVTWLEEGVVVGERLQRVIDVHEEFSRRVQRVRNER